MAANADPIAKVREMDASAVDAKEVLKMATVNGAHAMGLKDCDVLAAGKYADMIRIDLKQTHKTMRMILTKCCQQTLQCHGIVCIINHQSELV